ncbi:MAG: IS21 family transposase, partial [Desulfurivibrio sp.]
MIDYETFARIKQLHEQQGLRCSQIAAELQLDHRTVSHWLGEQCYRPRQATDKAGKLDPFKSIITALLERYPVLSARQLYQRLLDDGYQGSYSVVKRFVHRVRPKRQAAYLTLAFAPGECAQVDWGSYGLVRVGNTQRRLSFFVMVLCYSRQLYVEFTVSQTMEHFLAAHVNAFHAFGGVPARIMVDNLKSAVISRKPGAEPVLNPRYLDFANHYGFTITPCGVRKGNEKGRVESGVGYVKKNFLAGSELPEFTALAPAVTHWLDTVANVRTHGETKRRPVDLWQEEKPSLSPLPANPCDLANILPVRASSQFRVTLETNRYSVPARLTGARLTLKCYPDRLCIYHEQQLIARHLRSYERQRDFEDPDHARELINQRRKAKTQQLIRRFQEISPRADDYYRRLEERHLQPLRHVRQIMALVEIHGREAVVRAIDDAMELHVVGAEYIANILEARTRKLPEPGPLHLTRSADLLEIEIQQPNL